MIEDVFKEFIQIDSFSTDSMISLTIIFPNQNQEKKMIDSMVAQSVSSSGSNSNFDI